MNYISDIERKLGDWRKLPDNPFHQELDYAVFSSSNDQLVDEVLYEAIFELNEALGNDELVFKAFIDVNDKKPDLLVQNQKNWSSFDKFQELNLVYEGFYTSGDKLNWLGIYHPDDYFVVGAPKYVLEKLCLNVYGHLDWKKEISNKYESGQLEIYSEDFEELKKSLLL
ncbi:hypothetical protein [Catenovulum sediminis]|uniref:hypothetical protein n=1 Tax=Catenovulum sediminis TaxID=1740262 RepID=UPI0011802D53|nr:hypothetical protein [Catenovulum sediminis]